jgi:hypothetical protein
MEAIIMATRTSMSVKPFEGVSSPTGRAGREKVPKKGCVMILPFKVQQKIYTSDCVGCEILKACRTCTLHAKCMMVGGKASDRFVKIIASCDGKENTFFFTL